MNENNIPTGLEQPELPPQSLQEVTWTASEFIAHEKDASWYLGLAVASAIVAVVIYLITKDFVSVAVVVVAAVLLGVYGARQPRQLQYHLDDRGITIGQKHYSYGEFRSFSVVQQGAFASIEFMPLKRFAPALSIYYAPEDEDSIITLLSNQLPMEEPRRDLVENLMRRIRF